MTPPPPEPDAAPTPPPPALPAPRPPGPAVALGYALFLQAAGFMMQIMVGGMIVSLVDNPFGLSPQELVQEHTGLAVSLGLIAAAPLVLAMLWRMLERRGLDVRQYLLLGPLPRRATVLGIVALGLYLLLMGGLAAWLEQPSSQFMIDLQRTPPAVAPLLLLAVLGLAPVMEEVVFRGLLFRGLADSKLGAVGAVLVTAGVWTAVHLQYGGFELAGIFALGLLLGTLRAAGRSLTLCIAIHALNNAVAMAMLALDVGTARP